MCGMVTDLLPREIKHAGPITLQNPAKNVYMIKTLVRAHFLIHCRNVLVFSHVKLLNVVFISC